MNLKTNPELLPLIEWWEKDGKQLVIYLAIAALAVGGWYGYKGYRANQREAAATALANAYTTEELETAVTKFASQTVGGALRLRLAKNYFDLGRYEEALAAYEGLIGKAPEGFEDVPVVGRAQALEALGKADEALKAFDEFAQANPESFLALTAKLGAARALAETGDKAGALKRLDEMKKAAKDDELATARIEATESTVKRYVKAAATSAASK